MSLLAIVNGKQIIAIVCNQWGDTGKGKFVDIFAEWADVIARGAGGPNAGHTVRLGQETHIFHMIPSGILYDAFGKVNVLGNGMVVDLEGLCAELDILEEKRYPYNNLVISENAEVILPQHKIRDSKQFASPKKGSVGSTGKGIGPSYGDKILRIGVKVGDLANKDFFVNKLKKNLKAWRIRKLDVDEIVESQLKYFDRIKPFVRETYYLMNDFVSEGKKVLLEGAQGLLLSIEFGTTKYQTSSDSSIIGTCQGVSLNPNVVDLVLGMVKAPYMTRVGNGPFPTEFGGKDSEDYCADHSHTKEYELGAYQLGSLLKSKDELNHGIYARIKGEEYGATTGRPRRTGWLDLLALQYAAILNKSQRSAKADVIITKPDVMSGFEKIKMCAAYNLDGRIINQFPNRSEILERCEPIFIEMDGYKEDIGGIRDYEDLPLEAKSIFHMIESIGNVNIRAVSVGADREQTIFRG